MKSWRIHLKNPQREKRLSRSALAVIVLASMALGAVFSYTQAYTSGKPYIIDTSQELERLIGTGRPVAVMFTSPTCPVCKRMKAYWVKLAMQNGKGGVDFYIIELSDQTAGVFYRHGVRTTPTYMLFYKGALIARRVGEFHGQNVTQAMLEWATSSLFLSRPLSGKTVQANTTCTGDYCVVEPLPTGAGGGVGMPLALMVAVSFIAGVLASVSPCTLPLLIAHASISAKTKGRGPRIAGGCFAASTVSVLLLGMLFATFSWLLSSLRSFLAPSIAFLLIMLGTAGVAGYRIDLPAAFSAGRLGVYGVCGLFGFLSVQCNLPLVLGPFLMIVGAGSGDPVGALYLAVGYAMGLSVVLALVMSGSGRIASLVEKMLYRGELLNRVSGLIILLSGLFLATYYLT